MRKTLHLLRWPWVSLLWPVLRQDVDSSAFVMWGCSPACLRVATHETLWQVPSMWTHSIRYLWDPLAAQRISPFLFPFHTTRDSFPACIICGSLWRISTAPRRKAGPDRRQSLCFSLFRSTEGLWRLVSWMFFFLTEHAGTSCLLDYLFVVVV